MGPLSRKNRVKTRFLIIRNRPYLGVNIGYKLQDSAADIYLGSTPYYYIRRFGIIRAIGRRNLLEARGS